MPRVVLFQGPNRLLEVADFKEPRPEGDETIVRVLCCALCSSDLHTHAGRRDVETPTVLGHEIVGRIEAFGPTASRQDIRGAALAIGDRVNWSIAANCGSCYPCTHDLPQKCARLYKYGHQSFDAARPFAGGLADFVTLVRGTRIVRTPEELSDPVAASANCAAATVAAVIRSAVTPMRGCSILILGAGILGLTACAMARDAGAEAVIAVDPDALRKQRAKQFGATHVSSGDGAELAELVGEVTKGRGADVSLELAGVAEGVQAGLTLTRVGGIVVLAGTVLPTPSVPLHPEDVVRRMLTIRGVHNYVPRDLATALDFLAGPGKAYPFGNLMTATFPLDEIQSAFAFAHNHSGSRVPVVP
jgi:putative phosphonate catabolism associated alcohol dehydrogenase